MGNFEINIRWDCSGNWIGRKQTSLISQHSESFQSTPDLVVLAFSIVSVLGVVEILLGWALCFGDNNACVDSSGSEYVESLELLQSMNYDEKCAFYTILSHFKGNSYDDILCSIPDAVYSQSQAFTGSTGKTFQVFVRYKTTVVVDVDSELCIKQLKQEACGKLNVGTRMESMFNLYHNGTILGDTIRVADVVSSNELLNLIPRLRGGIPPTVRARKRRRTSTAEKFWRKKKSSLEVRLQFARQPESLVEQKPLM